VIGSGVHSSSLRCQCRECLETRDLSTSAGVLLYVHRGRRGHVQRAGGRHAGLRRGDWRRRGAGGTYNAGIGGLGGSGADVSATVTGLSVSTLYVEVGSNGTDGTGGTANCTAGDGGPTVAVSVDSLGATAAAAVVAVELRTCERRPRRPRTSPVRPATRVSWSPAVAVAVAVPITPKVVRRQRWYDAP